MKESIQNGLRYKLNKNDLKRLRAKSHCQLQIDLGKMIANM